jgi:anti-anti-sigma factor
VGAAPSRPRGTRRLTRRKRAIPTSSLEDFALAVSRDGGSALRIEVRGDLDHLSNTRLVALVADCLGSCDDIVVDLGDVTFIDAGGLTGLSRVVDLCKGARVGLAIEGHPPLLTRLLEVTKLELPRASGDHAGPQATDGSRE